MAGRVSLPGRARPDDGKLTLSRIASEFSDESEAYRLMERIRWPDGPICPHCGTVNEAHYLAPRNGSRQTRTGASTARRVWKCGACKQQFSVLVGTIFEDSKVPLSKWFAAIYLMCASKKGMSAHQIHRELDVTYKSAWFMCHRIRYAMQEGPGEPLKGDVEVDELFVGGKPRRKNNTRERVQGEKKAIVIGLKERGGSLTP